MFAFPCASRDIVRWVSAVGALLLLTSPMRVVRGVGAFQRPIATFTPHTNQLKSRSRSRSFASGLGPLASNSLDDEMGGFTTRQRLREEIESPFRKVRLLFFASTTGSALTALYFSVINSIKALSLAPGAAEATSFYGAPAVSLEEALSACAINLAGAAVCALLTIREYRVGQANLERIKRGGQLARLSVLPASTSTTSRRPILTLKDYRRSSRIVICAGGPEYVSSLCRQMASDPSQGLVDAMQGANLVVVPVLLQRSSADSVLVFPSTQQTWYDTQVPGEPGTDSLGSSSVDPVVAFPVDSASWSSYLESEIATAQTQGYDVMDKGITIIVKKSGRILRRATGFPNWTDLVSRIEVMDGSSFGMPGDEGKKS